MIMDHESTPDVGASPFARARIADTLRPRTVVPVSLAGPMEPTARGFRGERFRPVRDGVPKAERHRVRRGLPGRTPRGRRGFERTTVRSRMRVREEWSCAAIRAGWTDAPSS